MTKEERQLINECRVIIIGEDDFISYLKKELEQIGFKVIWVMSETDPSQISHGKGILIEHIEHRTPLSAEATDIPIIFAFDFIDGAGAIVVFPEDEKDFINP